IRLKINTNPTVSEQFEQQQTEIDRSKSGYVATNRREKRRIFKDNRFSMILPLLIPLPTVTNR
ncbi:hypothetical protein, partial [Vibrio cholerae]|uniref:hypothetical protein n=1 Tax=Vibrio cholerae TaxID=666 RepID=UPI003CC5B150